MQSDYRESRFTSDNVDYLRNLNYFSASIHLIVLPRTFVGDRILCQRFAQEGQAVENHTVLDLELEEPSSSPGSSIK